MVGAPDAAARCGWVSAKARMAAKSPTWVTLSPASALRSTITIDATNWGIVSARIRDPLLVPSLM